ncbi:hypothetical protein ANCDUO_10120 [Ancylostoma duodenale]|uniref:Uncharacterized protein n=1 Tax=Ancylostoma duodenale TaxID=51022 RepID=A0A0C2GL29_9BILA|nr:hypothetical protein ANCDUO_10120 [Ancylostoma duodenale]
MVYVDEKYVNGGVRFDAALAEEAKVTNPRVIRRRQSGYALFGVNWCLVGRNGQVDLLIRQRTLFKHKVGGPC